MDTDVLSLILRRTCLTNGLCVSLLMQHRVDRHLQLQTRRTGDSTLFASHTIVEWSVPLMDREIRCDLADTIKSELIVFVYRTTSIRLIASVRDRYLDAQPGVRRSSLSNPAFIGLVTSAL